MSFHASSSFCNFVNLILNRNLFFVSCIVILLQFYLINGLNLNNFNYQNDDTTTNMLKQLSYNDNPTETINELINSLTSEDLSSNEHATQMIQVLE